MKTKMVTSEIAADETAILGVQGRDLTWIEQAMAENPNQLLEVDPNDETTITIRPERNSRPTPAIGDKSLRSLINDIASIGQQLPGLATVNENGVLDLYAGFRRARAVQTYLQENPDSALTYRVLVTTTVLAPQEAFERSLSENVQREDMKPLERTAAIRTLMTDYSMSTKQVAAKMNMSPGSVSVYSRLELLPAVAKKACNDGRITYNYMEKCVQLLPKQWDIEKDESGELLATAQAAIEKMVIAELGKGSAKPAGKKEGEEGKAEAAGAKNRTSKQVLAEITTSIDAFVESGKKEDADVLKTLKAFSKFVQGGSLNALVKALKG